MSDTTNRRKVDAAQFCRHALRRIRRHIARQVETCELGEAEYGRCFRFSFTRIEVDGVEKTETFSVRREMIEDGFASEMFLSRALWHTLGRLRGMV